MRRRSRVLLHGRHRTPSEHAIGDFSVWQGIGPAVQSGQRSRPTEMQSCEPLIIGRQLLAEQIEGFARSALGIGKASRFEIRVSQIFQIRKHHRGIHGGLAPSLPGFLEHRQTLVNLA